MKKEPFITVFTPNYNCSEYISETIESIINQTYTNFEYIIIDDCSEDDSWSIIQNYANKDKRIKAYRNNTNLNVVKTRNRGFKLRYPHSKYFAIIDSDDIALSTRLENQVDFLEKNPDYGLVGSNIIITNKNSQNIGFRKYPSSNKKIKKIIVRYNPIAQSSVTLRTEVVKQVGNYTTKWIFCEDYDYWLRVGMSWKLANLNKPLIKYRISETQIKKRYLKENIKQTYKIQENAIKNYGYKDSVFNKFIRYILKLSVFFPNIILITYHVKIRFLKGN